MFRFFSPMIRPRFTLLAAVGRHLNSLHLKPTKKNIFIIRIMLNAMRVIVIVTHFFIILFWFRSFFASLAIFFTRSVFFYLLFSLFHSLRLLDLLFLFVLYVFEVIRKHFNLIFFLIRFLQHIFAPRFAKLLNHSCNKLRTKSTNELKNVQ